MRRERHAKPSEVENFLIESAMVHFNLAAFNATLERVRVQKAVAAKT